jgi:hypothetical protein
MRPVFSPTRSLSYSCYTTNGAVDGALLLQDSSRYGNCRLTGSKYLRNVRTFL